MCKQFESTSNLIHMVPGMRTRLTSLWRADDADPRSSGSTASKTSSNCNAGCGKPLKASAKDLLYGLRGLKV